VAVASNFVSPRTRGAILFYGRYRPSHRNGRPINRR
jgi:hypothetical protein